MVYRFLNIRAGKAHADYPCPNKEKMEMIAQRDFDILMLDEDEDMECLSPDIYLTVAEVTRCEPSSLIGEHLLL